MAEFFKMFASDLDSFARNMEKEDKRRIKAGETAVKVEGFRLMKVLKKEIRRGMPGGRRFAFLSMIARRLPVRKKTIALSRLAIPVRYNAVREGKNLAVNVGFVGGGRAGKLSKSWRRIVTAQQEGFSGSVDAEKRRRLLGRGIVLKKRKDPEAKFFFLKKGTNRFRTPARPIIAPFWHAHEREAMANIKDNFRRKMAGERI